MGPYELLQKVITAFEELNIRYIVTGSVASMAYGEPRLTNDIDIVADIKLEQIAFLERYFPHDEFYFDRDMAINAINAINHKSQFNIIHPASGLKVDIILYKDTEFDCSRFTRSKRIQPAEEYRADFAAPEDVIIKKMEYYKEGGSDKHLRDITGILKVSGHDVDREYIITWAKKMGLMKIWEAVEARVSDGK
jgi:hypothetical protein